MLSVGIGRDKKWVYGLFLYFGFGLFESAISSKLFMGGTKKTLRSITGQSWLIFFKELICNLDNIFQYYLFI